MVGKSEALVIKSEDETEEEVVETPEVEEEKGDYKDKEEDEEEEEDEKKKKEKKEMKSDFEEFVITALSELKSEKTPVAHPLDGAIEQLKSVYDVAVEMDDAQAALQTIQEPFEVLGKAIQDNLITQEPEAVPEEPVSVEGNIAQLLSEFRTEMSQEIGLLRAEIAAVKPGEQPQAPQIPQRRSMGLSPELIAKPAEQKSKTPKLREIVDRSVGIG
jgi:flagellar hook-basal body complex protein FliE